MNERKQRVPKDRNVIRDYYKEAEIIHSKRKTIGLTIKEDGRIIVRAPLRYPKYKIRAFVEDHEDWIEKTLKKIETEKKNRANEDPVEHISPEQRKVLIANAKRIIPERVAYYAPKVGVTYGTITIRSQKTRWGSCTAKGNLNFNCLLMLAPPQVLDSVVVHELCHRKEMNHSQRFYKEVYRVFPEYDFWNKWLKENGRELIERLG